MRRPYRKSFENKANARSYEKAAKKDGYETTRHHYPDHTVVFCWKKKSQ